MRYKIYTRRLGENEVERHETDDREFAKRLYRRTIKDCPVDTVYLVAFLNT